jgi:carbon monoxide dehydrogenase subunit G
VRFEGEFPVDAPPDRVRAVLLDVEGLATCLPGAENVRQTESGRYAGTLKVRLGPIAASFELTGALAQTDERFDFDIRGRERLTATVVQSRFEVRLGADDAGARVGYLLDVTLLGKLGQMGQAVFQDVARRMTEQTIACLRQRIERGG